MIRLLCLQKLLDVPHFVCRQQLRVYIGYSKPGCSFPGSSGVIACEHHSLLNAFFAKQRQRVSSAGFDFVGNDQMAKAVSFKSNENNRSSLNRRICGNSLT